MTTIDIDELAAVTGGADDPARVQALARYLNLSPDAIGKIGLGTAEATTRKMLEQQLGRP